MYLSSITHRSGIDTTVLGGSSSLKLQIDINVGTAKQNVL